jgi:hypothetical protein
MDNKLINRLTVFISGLLVVRFGASFLPNTRLWGFNHAAFIDNMEALYLIFIAAVILIHYKRNKLSTRKSSSKPFANERGLWSDLIAYTVVLICAGTFYLLSVKSYFLGDGLTIIASPEMSIKYREFGEVIIHKWLAGTVGAPTGDSILLAYRTLSIASGLLFSIALIFYGKKITSTRFGFWMFLFLTLTSANTILFYGYVENYTMTTAVIGISILSAVSSLRDGRKSPIPIVGLIVASFLHSAGLVYLPALLTYIVLTFSGEKIRRYITLRPGTIILTMITLFIIGYAVVRIWAPMFWKMALLPPFGDLFTTDGYFLLSLSHIIDYANLLFFMIPAALVVWILWIISHRRLRVKRRGPEYLFLNVAAFSGLIGAFILEPKLGMARDWDLVSVFLIGGGIFGIYAWVEGYSSQKYFKPASYLMLLFCLSIFIPWLAMHNSPDALGRYSVAVMKLDPKHSRSGLLTMWDYLEKQGKSSAAQDLALYCKWEYPERQYDRAGADCYYRGEYIKGERAFKLGLKENPSMYALHLGLGMCQLKMGNYEEALGNLLIADGLNPYSPVIYNYLAEAYSNLGDSSRALKYWHKSVDGNRLIPEAYLALGIQHLKNRQGDSARHYLLMIPDSIMPPEAHYWSGLTSLLLSDTADALDNFDYYLKQGRDSTLIQNINELKDKLNQADTGFTE